MKKYRCRKCQDTFTDIGEADFHSYDAHNLEFEDCIREIEGENLVEDSPEENPSEIDSMTEEELKNKARAVVSVDQYMEGELSETEAKMLISRLMGQTTGKKHDKVFPEKANTSNAFEKQFRSIVERLSDTESISCPLCGELWSTIKESSREYLGEQHKNLEGKFPLIRIHHIKTKHIPIWNLIKNLFGMGADEIPDERPSTTPNPESTSITENPSEFTKEELASKICEDEETRRKFFREWLRRLNRKD